MILFVALAKSRFVPLSRYRSIFLPFQRPRNWQSKTRLIESHSFSISSPIRSLENPTKVVEVSSELSTEPDNTSALEAQLLSLPLLQSLRSAPDSGEWYEVRPYKAMSEERRKNNLTAGSLCGPGMLALPPLARVRRDEGESFVFVHLGGRLCGHEGIVHGGLMALLLDESMGRTALNNLPARVGVTASLNLNYRAPTRASQFVVIHTKLDHIKGRRATVSGTVEDMDGTLLVDATGLFVQPRDLSLLDRASIHQVIGESMAQQVQG